MGRLSDRARRRALAKKLETSKALEQRYSRALRGVLAEMHKTTLDFVTQRTDANIPTGFPQFVTEQLAGVSMRVGRLFDRHVRDVETANKRALKVVGVKGSDLGLDALLARKRAENVDLVVKAGREYASQVEALFSDPANFGRTVEELKADLVERASVSESRAELIARDQTLKLNGQITQARQENAGVTEYVWSTSLDERVRDDHSALEGQTFSWSAPPSIGHPGQDIQCRCVAIPLIT